MVGSDERTLTLTLVKRASSYEVVHYIGHAGYNPNLKASDLIAHKARIEEEIAKQTGFAAFVRNINIRHYAPFLTDVDFVIDSPSESPIAPVVIGGVIAALKIALPVILALIGLAIVIFLWWTSWVEKEKVYICEQDDPPTRWDGWLAYVGHLKEAHPTKYAGVLEAQSHNWWEQITGVVPWIVGGAIVLAVLGLLPKRRERE